MNADLTAALDRENPWPGLASFTEDQSQLFHGRDEEVRALARLMERKALTVLFGQSGLGKSSLLQAGVFPRLRAAGFCPVYVRLDHGDGALTPAEQVKATVAAATARAGTWTRPGAARPGESLWEYLHHRDDRLVDADGRSVVPVLVFDQFEELFTLGAGAGAQRERALAFIGELAELVENRPSEQLVARLERSADEMDAFDFSRTDYRVCISLREDFLPHLEGLKTIMPALMENRMRLTRMTGTQALEAVVKPGGALVTEEVARAIVEFVAGARGGSVERLAELDVEPPLLSVICRELNERRRSLGQAQITADLVTGNRREILTDFYERSVGDLPEGVRRFVEDKLLTKSGFRDNLALETALEEPGVTRAEVDTLVQRRLLRIEDRLGTPRVELTHDVLADVVRASRDARQSRLLVQKEVRRARRMRFVVAGLAAVVCALAAGVAWGIRAQRASAMQASESEFLLGSRLLDEGKVSEGLAYLVRAGRQDPRNPLVAPRLLTELAARRFTVPTAPPLQLSSPVHRGAFTADGKWLIVQTEDGTLRAIDPVAGRVEREFQFEHKPLRGRWALVPGDATKLFVGFGEPGLAVCDIASGRLVSPYMCPPGGAAITNGSLSLDGRWLALTDAEKTYLFSTSDGRLHATVPGRGQLAFSSDGTRLASYFATQNGGHASAVWSVPDGNAVGEPIPYASQGQAWGRFFSADGSKLYVRHSQTIRTYEVATGRESGPPIAYDLSGVSNALLTPDGRRLVICGGDRRVLVLDLETGRPALPLLEHGGPVSAAEFSRDGSVLLTHSVDGYFRLWDMATGRLLVEPTFRQRRGAPAALSPDAKRVAAFTSTGLAHLLRPTGGPAVPLVLPRAEDVKLVNLVPDAPTRLAWVTATEYRAIDAASGRSANGGFSFPARIEGPTGAVRSSFGQTFGAGDTMVVQTAPAGTPAQWRAWTLGKHGVAHDVELKDVPADVQLFRISPEGPFGIAVGNSVSRGAIAIWNLRTGELAAKVPVRGTYATEAGFYPVVSSDGRYVAYRGADTVIVAETTSGQERLRIEPDESGAEPFAHRFTPDGLLLIGDTWGGVHVWNVSTGQRLHSTQAHRTDVRRFDYAFDRRRYASLARDGSMQVWDMQTHAPVGPVLEHGGLAVRADFSREGTRILTPSSAGARVWDVRSGLALTPLMVPEGATPGIGGYGPDGRFVEAHGTVAGESIISVWAAPPDGRGASTPAWLLQLATLCAGVRFDEQGKLGNVSEELREFDRIRREIDALPATDPYAQWARWILSDDPARPIAPHFTVTPAEAARIRAEFGRSGQAEPAPAR